MGEDQEKLSGCSHWIISSREGEGGLESTSIDCVQSSGTLSDIHLVFRVVQA